MKKLSLLYLLLTVFIFAACSDDDKATLVTSFEGKLTEANSEFIAKKDLALYESGTTTFQDNNNAITFPHSYGNFGEGYEYSFSDFTYTNKTDNSAANSITAITKKGKLGTTYLCVYALEPTKFTINNPGIYKIKGAWVTNSTYAYNAMTVGDGYAEAFKKDSWFKLTATAYGPSSIKIQTAEIYLANYKSDNDKPVNEWIWFDMSELEDAIAIEFSLSSTDNGQWGMNTPAYFCIDGITLEEK